ENCREFGLGRAKQAIPLVFTYVALDAEGKALEEALRNRGDIRTVPLGVFEPGSDRLAVSQFVITHHKLAFSLRRDKRPYIDGFYEAMRDDTQGRPGRFLCGEARATIAAYKRLEVLVDADFGRFLSTWK